MVQIEHREFHASRHFVASKEEIDVHNEFINNLKLGKNKKTGEAYDVVWARTE